MMFLTRIAQTGRISVPHPEDDPKGLERLLEEDVIEREAAHRMELLHPVPAFDVAAGVLAARVLFRCCQFLIYRNLGPAAVEKTLQAVPPGPANTSRCYSMDVAFCLLPDLWHLARGISPDDPLVAGMSALARAWPLSSVGMPDLGDVDVSAFIEDRSLRELYVQRIIARRDRTRLTHPRVAAAVREAVGAYDTLAPELLSAISKEKTP